KMLG
ncbi:hypothetical protein CP8484711_1280B, partial [Chlamydia psittaci 84-8471/1]